jgi:predicted TIM-barrel fold metal-dependent hydrolase
MSEQIISADDHIDLCYLPTDLWQTRLPAKWKAEGPRVEQLAAGPTWVREGAAWGMWGEKKLDFRINVFDRLGYPEEVEPGRWRATDPKYRLQDMDSDGVHAQVIYNFLNWSFTDQELKTACVQAFNTWLAEEMCRAAPDRLIGLATLPGHDGAAAVAELHRAARIGLKGVIFDVFGATKPIFDPEWEPLWAAASEAGMPVSVHTGAGTFSINKLPSGTPWKFPAFAAILGMQLEEVMVSMIFSGILERHPKLKFVLGEAGIGWIPFVLERLEYEVKQFYAVAGGVPIKRSPREIFNAQVFSTFQDETLGVKLIPEIGVGNVMWAADYPHGDGTFPNSKDVIQRMFGNADAETRRKVLGGNAKALYNIA